MKMLLLLCSLLAGSSAYEVCTPENRCADIAAASAEGKQPRSNDDASTCLGDCKVRKWLNDFESRLRPARVAEAKAFYAYVTNATDKNAEAKNEGKLKVSNLFAKASAQAFQNFDVSDIQDPNVKRDIRYILQHHTGSTPEEREENTKLEDEIWSRIIRGKICPAALPDNCNDGKKIPLLPGVKDIMKSSRNETELRIMWQRWHDVAGKPSRETFFELVERRNKQNERIKTNTLADSLLQDYGEDQQSFYAELVDLYTEVLPFYEDLHAYVRFKLNNFYGDEIVPASDTMPVHVLGDMYANDWLNIYDLVEPYPNAKPKKPSIEQAIKSQNWTAETTFRKGEDLFESIGMPPLPSTFWKYSMFEQPKDGRKVDCNPWAQYVDVQDVRVTMCTGVQDEYSYRTVYNMLGHLYYGLACEKQSPLHQRGANPGFHWAFGDMIQLSARKNAYLKHIGLLKSNYVPSPEVEINDQMLAALATLPYLPDAYVLDEWRRWTYNNTNRKEKANDYYWILQKKALGLHPPVRRTPEDFDPAARYHVSSFDPAVHQAVAIYLQYDFHNSLCKAGSPSTCSIFNDKEAGAKLWKALEMGSSKPWQEALRVITGRSKMSAQPLLKYFSKLAKWLREENKKNGVCMGWGDEFLKGAKVNGPRC